MIGKEEGDQSSLSLVKSDQVTALHVDALGQDSGKAARYIQPGIFAHAQPYCCYYDTIVFFGQLLIYGYVRISQNTPCNIQYPDLVRSRALRKQRHEKRNNYNGTEENPRAPRKIKVEILGEVGCRQ